MRRSQKNIVLFLLFFFIIQGASAQYFSGTKTYKAAISAFKEKNYYSARILFQEIINKAPTGEYGDDAQYYLALTYFFDSDYKSAIFEIKVLKRDFPVSRFVPLAEYRLGECYYFLKNYKASLKSHHDFVRKYPQHKRAADALYTTGFIYLDQKRYDEAIAEFNRVLEAYPESKIAPQVALQIGIAYYNTKEYSDAREQFKSLILKYNQSNMIEQAQFWVGKTYYSEGKYDEAEREFRFVIEKFPDDAIAPEAVYYISLCQYKKNNLNKAIEYLNKIEADYPKWQKLYNVYYRRGQVYFTLKQYDNSLKNLQVIEKKYKSSTYYLPSLELMGDIWQKTGRSSEAITLYDKLISAAKTDPMVKPALIRKKANIFLLDKNYTEAAKSYQALYKTYPNRKEAPEAMYLHAQSLFNQQLNADAIEILKRLIKKYPRSSYKVDAYYLQAEIYFALSNYTRALQLYRKVVKFYPKHRRHFDSYMGIGWSYFEIKQYSRSADIFRKIIKKYTKKRQRVDTYMALAACMYNLRDFKKAIRIYIGVTKRYLKYKDKVEEAYFQIAWVYYRQKQFKKSITAFNLYAKKYAKGSRAVEVAHYNGWSHFQINNYQKAAINFRQAYNIAPVGNPFKAKSLLDYAKALKEQHKFTDSYNTLTTFVRKYKDTNYIEEAYYNRSELALEIKKPGLAYQDYEQLKKISAKAKYLPEILRNIGDYYREKGDMANAEKAYLRIEETAQSTDERVEAMFARVQLYLDSKRNNKAKNLLTQIISEKNQEISIYKSRALTQFIEILNSEKNYAAILAKIEKEKVQFKSDKETMALLYIWLGRANLSLKKYSQARQKLKPWLKHAQLGLIARFYYAMSFLGQGNLAPAFDYFKQVVQKGEGSYAARALFQMGEIHFIQQKYDRAIRNYTKVIYLYSGIEDIFEKSLYKTALCFKISEKLNEYNSYKKKLKEAFPSSKYLALLK